MTNDQERKAEVLRFADRLCIVGVSKVIASYSGCGDEGHIDSIEFTDSMDNLIDEAKLPGDLDTAQLGELLEGFAPEGYGDNDGGYGTVTFVVETGVVRIEHSWYETISHADDPREV
jgi:hypothetical protein